MGGLPDSVFSNCAPQGLVSIIQRRDSPCPEASPLRGIFIYNFREPIEFVKALSLLGIQSDNNPATVSVLLESGSAAKSIKLIDTGRNGV